MLEHWYSSCIPIKVIHVTSIYGAKKTQKQKLRKWSGKKFSHGVLFLEEYWIDVWMTLAFDVAAIVAIDGNPIVFVSSPSFYYALHNLHNLMKKKTSRNEVTNKEYDNDDKEE